MTIDAIYREILIEDFIKEQLTRGVAISSIDVATQLEAFLEDKDLTLPQFLASSYYVSELESSSSAKHANTFSAMKLDLRALYKEMISLAKVSSDAFERWKLDATGLEKRLIDLEDRIENLLLLTQDTEGHHSILVDNFTDTSQIDLSLSTVDVNLITSTVQMGETSGSRVRVFLNDLDLAKDVSFRVRTTTSFVNRTDAANSDLRDPFNQESKTWWTSVAMSKPKPVTCEYTIRLDPNEAVSISQIIVDLHESAESSPTFVTPLYSTDNQIFNQLPTNTFTQEVRTNAVFLFPEIEAQWIKFILTKEGPDPSAGSEFFFYEFGFKDIEFYTAGFDSTTSQSMVSRPLWVISEDGSPLEFEKLTVETCERIEDNTKIDYFITTTNTLDDIDDNFDNDTALWVPISPVQRAIPQYPLILDVGDIAATTIGDDEVLKISHESEATASSSLLVNPADDFHLLSRNATTGTVIDDTVAVATGPVVRYSFRNTSDRILNYQIKDTSYTGSGAGEELKMNEANLLLFRNVGAQGLDPTASTSKVRDVLRGWRFADPYYSCVIEVQNPNGMSIDVGDTDIIIDDIKYTNKIDETVLTGKTAVETGLHTIQVHKSNWKGVAAGATTLAGLKAIDSLYPFNHKLLIEGYSYDSGFTDDKVYLGADVFAEKVMKQISIFDLMNNITPNNYDVFALDRDAPNSHTSGNDPTRVFVMKVDENNPDFQNERFVIRFTLINQLQKYLRIRADLSTEDDKITPAFYAYKIKLG